MGPVVSKFAQQKTDESVSSEPWYVVRSKPQCERYAQMHLLRQKYRVYLPLYARWKRRLGEWHRRQDPWFPGYLFVQLSDAEQSLTPIHSTYGVSCLVRFGDSYARVPGQFVTDLKVLEDQQRQFIEAGMSPFRRGQKVRIQTGVFQGRDAVVAHSAQQRVTVLLQMMGRRLKDDLDSAEVS